MKYSNFPTYEFLSVKAYFLVSKCEGRSFHPQRRVGFPP